MGFFSKFEGRFEDAFEGAADKIFDSPISPVQIAKKAEREMRREKMVGAGKMYAPTLYTVLVNPDDDRRLFGYYPTLAGETETYISAKAAEYNYVMDGQPLVRFVADDSLKSGKFDIIAELVSRPIVAHLRADEMKRYGLLGANDAPSAADVAPEPRQAAESPAIPGFIPAEDYYGYPAYDGRILSAPIPGSVEEQAQDQALAEDFHFSDDFSEPSSFTGQELPYVPEEEIDRSVNYGQYTFDSHDFVNPAHTPVAVPPLAAAADMTVGMQAMDAARVFQCTLTDLSTHEVITITGPRATIGRDSQSTVVLQDLNASRNHAELTCSSSGEWSLTDLGSTNGTQVNGQRISRALLHAHDRITIGVTSYLFSEAPLHSSL